MEQYIITLISRWDWGFTARTFGPWGLATLEDTIRHIVSHHCNKHGSGLKISPAGWLERGNDNDSFGEEDFFGWVIAIDPYIMGECRFSYTPDGEAYIPRTGVSLAEVMDSYNGEGYSKFLAEAEIEAKAGREIPKPPKKEWESLPSYEGLRTVKFLAELKAKRKQ